MGTFAVVAFSLLVNSAVLLITRGSYESFLSGDRSIDRAARITSVLNSSSADLAGIIARQGQPGDYFLHTAFWYLGGPHLVLAAQILMAICTTIIAMKLAGECFGRGRWQVVTGIIVALSPGLIDSSHSLMTDGPFALTVTCTAYLAIEIARKGRTIDLVLCVIAIAAAAYLRGNGIFLLLLLPLLAWYRRGSLAPFLVAGLTTLLLYPGVWMAWRYWQTGDIGLGPSDASIDVNICIRAVRTAAVARLPDPICSDLSRAQLLSFMLEHKTAMLTTYIADFLNIVFNPGTNQLFGHLLKIIEVPDDYGYWNRILTNDGLLALFAAIHRQGEAFAIVFVGLLLAHLCILFLALRGALAIFKGQTPGSESRLVGTIILAVIVIVFSTSFLAGGLRWTHRTPMEPMIAVLATAGIFRLVSYRASRREISTTPVHGSAVGEPAPAERRSQAAGVIGGP